MNNESSVMVNKLKRVEFSDMAFLFYERMKIYLIVH